MIARRWRSSVRAKILTIVIVGILVPLTLIGVWTSNQLERAGKDLLRSELNSTLAEVERFIARDWTVRRGELMLLAENSVVPHLITEGRQPTTTEEQFLRDAMAQLGSSVTEVTWTDMSGAARWRLGPNPGGTVEFSQANNGEIPQSRIGQLAVRVPVTDGATDQTYGSLIAALRASTLIPSYRILAVPSARFQVVDVSAQVPVLVVEGANTGVTSSSDTVAVRRRLNALPLLLEASAPAAPYVAPFGARVRQGTILTLLVAVVALGGASIITARVTQSLAALGDSADAVARGDFDQKLEVNSSDELGRVAAAFNTMTQDLRRTVQELAQRRSMAAVGEFAAELAHEVRNPLTAVRLDLQRLNERLPADGDLHERMKRILSVVDRLNRTVTGSLRVARSGSVTLRSVALSTALEPAIEASTPEFHARGVSLRRDGIEANVVWLKGDPDALTQLFLNLLLNAAQAIDGGGDVVVTIDRRESAVAVAIADNGRGMPDEMLDRLQQPMQSTKASGTGLGVSIARRIASAHGGAIDFTSRLGQGTTVTVTLQGATPPT